MAKNEADREFLDSPEMLAFSQSPEGKRLLRPGLLKFLAEVGITPQIDTETGELVIDAAALAAALGTPVSGMDGAKVVPAGRLKPLQ